MLTNLLILSLSTAALAQDFEELEPIRGVIGEEEPVTPPPAEELVGMRYEEFLRTYGSSSWVYQMDHRLEPYTGPSIEAPFRDWMGHGAWRAHAMQWKDYLSSGGSVGPSLFGFDVTAVANSVSNGGLNQPTDEPVCQTTFGGTDDVRLNDAEADSNVFSVGDPAGTWMCEIETDPAVGMIFSALVMHYWGSPVYLPALHAYGSPNVGTVSHTAGLELIDFSHNLHQACGLSSTAPAGTVLAGPFSCNSALVMQGTDVTLWNHLYPGIPAGIYVEYEQHKTLANFELVNAWQGASAFNGHLVFDPPAEANEEDVAGMVQLAAALADQLMAVDSEGNLVMFRDLVVEEVETVEEVQTFEAADAPMLKTR